MAARKRIDKSELAIVVPGPDELGPRMLALSDKQRKFVWAMQFASNATEAARLAGFAKNSDSAARVRAHEMMHDERVLAALHEVAWKRLNGTAMKAVAGLERIVDDPTHDNHLKAIEMVLNRTGFVAQTEHRVVVEHKTNDLQMKALAARFAAQTGVPVAKLLGMNEVIDAEFEPVDAGNGQAADPARAGDGAAMGGGSAEI